MPAELFRFKEFELDRGAFELRRDGQSVHLERIPFELLCLLVERNGQLVAREEIIASIWGKDVYLDTEHAINTAIRKIRKALKDDSEAPRFVLTVPAKGYRFVATIQQPEQPRSDGVADASQTVTAAPPPAASRERSSRGWTLFLLFAIFLVATSLLTFLRFHRVQALTEKDTIVLADFSNSTGDPVFDGALKQGLEMDLSQSPVLNILSEQKVRATLREMTRSPDELLTKSAAREVCERTGSKAYIAGSVANLGGQYVIGLSAINCATGDTLAREQTEAVGKQQVLAALDKAAEKLRSELGESLSSIQRFNVPLTQATTSSLEALKAYSFGLAKYGRGDQAGSIPLFQQAIEQDPDFAMAYANLGRAYQVLGQATLCDEAIRKAFALRNRVSERERFDISAAYYQFETLQTDQTIQNCELWAQTYPRDFTPHRILGFENAVLGKYEQSAEEFGKAMELDPSQALPYAGLIFVNMDLNRMADAHAMYQKAQQRKLDFGEPQRARYFLAFLEDDKEMMAKTAASLSSQPGFENKALSDQSKTEAYLGQFNAARELSRRIKDKALREGDTATAADAESDEALRDALCDDWEGARSHAAAALKLGGKPAMALALVGDSLSAAQTGDRLATQAPPGSFGSRVWMPEIQAAIEFKRGNPARAVELLGLATPYESGWFDAFLAAYLRGEAYLAAHRSQEAAAEFQKILDHHSVVLNSLIGALARLQIGRAYALQGETARARDAYQDFFTLWKDADPDIPLLLTAKAEYAKLQ
jgi:DNA-binding winged helix-turn-helix (wHTH) protein/Flp pilus assembly protein TadD